MSYVIDARYRRHVEAALRLAMAEAARDAVYRADGDAPFAPVPKNLYSPDAKGAVEITFTELPDAPVPAPDVDHHERVGESLS